MNNAIDGLSGVLSDVSRAELQTAILGASGDFFRTLPIAVESSALNVIVEAIEKVYVSHIPTCVKRVGLLWPQVHSCLHIWHRRAFVRRFHERMFEAIHIVQEH